MFDHRHHQLSHPGSKKECPNMQQLQGTMTFDSCFVAEVCGMQKSNRVFFAMATICSSVQLIIIMFLINIQC